MKIKKNYCAGLYVLAVFFLMGCATVYDLTPSAIDTDIRGDNRSGDENLIFCQFLLSKNIVLRYEETKTDRNISESGTVKIREDTQRNIIYINDSTDGVLRTKTGDGKTVSGMAYGKNRSGARTLTLQILFEESNDDFLDFVALRDEPYDKFELNMDNNQQVMYNGILYTISYEGAERPYLRYKLIRRETDNEKRRTAKGRKVGT